MGLSEQFAFLLKTSSCESQDFLEFSFPSLRSWKMLQSSLRLWDSSSHPRWEKVPSGPLLGAERVVEQMLLLIRL